MPRLNGRHLFMACAFSLAILCWMAVSKNKKGAETRRAGGSMGKPPHKSTSERSARYQLLSTWGAIFASLAAVGGLVFTAFSVRYQAEQTGLQAAASRTQIDQQNKQQARLVNVWAASNFSPSSILVTVSSRSQEPIYQFRVYIAFATSGSHGYLAIATWSSFPPCTQATFDLRAIAESYRDTAKMISPHRVDNFDYGIMFKDASGQAWHRHASGTLHATPWLEYLTQRGYFSPVLPPVFRSFTPLLADQFTTPESSNKFISVGPEGASSCDPNV